MLTRYYTQLTNEDCLDTAKLDRFKTLLRLLISYEGQQRHGCHGLSVVESPSQATVVAAAAARRVDLRRYKTELCRSFAETGHCRYGVKCQFAHGADELRPLARHPRYRTELCHSFHVNGFCPYGSRCNFIHSDVTAPAEASGAQKPTAVPPQQQAEGSDCELLKELLSGMKQRAICGRSATVDVCPVALMQALGPSQASAHLKFTQDR